MAEDKALRPIIVVKRRVNAAGHHGGAWKVAYADFVTAMMAFFMVMWLVAAVSKEQRAALFEYFKNPSMEQGMSVKAAPGQAGPGGASTSVIDLGGGLDSPKADLEDKGLGKDSVDPDDAKAVAEAEERKQLEALKQELEEAIGRSQALEPFKDQLLLDITPEGLRIQIVDKLARPMFDSGSSQLKDYTIEILRELAKYLNTVPNRVSLSGHTDAKPYASRGVRNYSNWELSADRANAARRSLLEGGLDADKISRVVGLASSVLFYKQEPLNPINRRISIIVMTKEAEAAALATDAPLALPPGSAAESAETPAPADATSPGAAAAVEPSAAPVASGTAAPAVAAAPATAAAAATPPAPPTVTINPVTGRPTPDAAAAAVAAALKSVNSR